MLGRRRLLSIAPIAVTLVACGNRLPELNIVTPTPSPPRRLRVVRSENDGNRPFLDLAISRVPAERRLAIEVRSVTPVRRDVGLGGANVETIPRDLAIWPPFHANALEALTGESVPDLVAVDSRWLSALGRSDLLRDLTTVLSGVSWFKADSFVNNALEAGRWRGRQLALPLMANVDALVYDASAFAEARLRLPSAEWQWSELLGAARGLTRPGRSGIYLHESAPRLPSIAWQWGADLVSRDGARLDVREPGTVASLIYMADLVHRHGVTAPVEADSPRYIDATMAGRRAAMVGGSIGGLVWWRSPRTEGFTIAPWPGGERRASAAFAPLMLGIPRNAPDPSLSLEAMGAVADAALGCLLMPTRTTAPDLRTINLSVGAEDVAGMRAVLDVARFIPGDLPWFKLAPALERELMRPVLMKEKGPEQAAADAQKTVDLLVAQSA